MPLPFVLVCDLLEQAYKQCKTGDKNLKQRVSNWFTLHRQHIDDPGTDASALLSTLLPDKRTDRVYCIQVDTLANIIGRTFGLGTSRLQELRRYKEAGRGEDLADCVERIFKETVSYWLRYRLELRSFPQLMDEEAIGGSAHADITASLLLSASEKML